MLDADPAGSPLALRAGGGDKDGGVYVLVRATTGERWSGEVPNKKRML